jgi:hypothetical protein
VAPAVLTKFARHHGKYVARPVAPNEMTEQEAREFVELLAAPEAAEPPPCPICGCGHPLETPCPIHAGGRVHKAPRSGRAPGVVGDPST